MSIKSMIGRAFAAAAVVAAGLTAFGETLTWTGEVSPDWTEAGNWSPAQVPAAGDALVIPAELEVYPQLAPTNWPENGSYASLTVAAGAKIVCLGDKAADGLGRGPWITADEMLIDGTLDAVGQGFRNRTGKGTDGRCCSASHGGLGSWMWRYWQTWPDQGANPYGDCAAPVTLGSSTSAAGGGAVKLVSSGTITVNGTIDASAENKKGSASGGNVWIVCETLAGASSGRIRANGSPTPDSHGGAGGRVALDYSTKTYVGTVTVDCTPSVAAYYCNGMPGTIYEPKRYPIGTPEEPAEVT